MSNPPPKLLDDAREVLRTRHYAYRTEQSSIDWMRRSILCHQKRHPREMGRPESEALLIHLATEPARGCINPESGTERHPFSVSLCP